MDKQIIIDGVNVSGCEKQGETIAGITCGNGERIRLANEIITKHKLCKDNPNCVYKQLKSQEQECEELKEKVKKYGEINEQETKDYAELKAENDLFRTCHDNEQAKRRKYEQTLIEIKEVLQFYNNTTIGTDKGNGIFEFEVSNDNILGGKFICCYDTNPAKKALQKISECEVEDEQL